ncbi:hypothetical protein EMPS_04653 [Entomortierella parvispora]|uniref:Uncharacterized protein n=1 Tax=Entomortierella parvispora TaxID=205924 RepID=A0A9P3LVL8_9FUNG|nr:hypothetical protein EMPS_04653 [Entomortierella parvispora]
MGRHFRQPMTEDFIRQHAPLVERLSIRVDPQHYQQVNGNLHEELCLRTIDFPKLTSLDIGIQKGVAYLDSQTRDMAYLTSELFRLMLESSSALNNGGQGLPMLQVLKITDFHFKFLPRDWMTLWETLWSRLQVLSLIGLWWEEYQVFPEEDNMDDSDDENMMTQWNRQDELCDPEKMEDLAKRLGPSLTMRELTLVNRGSQENSALYAIQKWMVEQCPNVVRLEWSVTWRIRSDEKPLAMMRDLIVSGRQEDPPQFQKLETLALPAKFNEDEFLDLAKAMPRMTELNFFGTRHFDGSAWLLFKIATPHHLNTIRVVDVSWSGLNAMVMLDILCSLPRLEDFRGDYVADRDLQNDPRPWACRKTLKRLSLDFNITSQRRLLAQRMILGRLAELEQLEDLIVSDSHLRLDLSKPKGMLESLKALKNLKRLSLGTRREHFNCDWGLAEIAWVRENCPKLKYVDRVHYKEEVGEEDRFPPAPQ